MTDTVFDRIRGIDLKATPEELVRQRVIIWLEQSGIAAACIGREVPVKYCGKNLRADLVAYSKEGKPFLLIECKAPSVEITERTLLQAFEYNRILDARYVMATNGKKTYCYKKENGKFRQMTDTEEIFNAYETKIVHSHAAADRSECIGPDGDSGCGSH